MIYSCQVFLRWYDIFIHIVLLSIYIYDYLEKTHKVEVPFCIVYSLQGVVYMLIVRGKIKAGRREFETIVYLQIVYITCLAAAVLSIFFRDFAHRSMYKIDIKSPLHVSLFFFNNLNKKRLFCQVCDFVNTKKC